MSIFSLYVCIYYILMLFLYEILVSATPETGHLHSKDGHRVLLLTSGSFIRRVLYYNVYTILHVTNPKSVYYFTKLYKTLQYFSKLYNTLQCRIEIHYLSQDVPAVAACISTPGFLQFKHRVWWFLVKRTQGCQSVRVCVSLWQVWGFCKEMT